MKLSEVIEFLKKHYDPNEELHIANLPNFKTIAISQKTIYGIEVSWDKELAFLDHFDSETNEKLGRKLFKPFKAGEINEKDKSNRGKKGIND